MESLTQTGIILYLRRSHRQVFNFEDLHRLFPSRKSGTLSKTIYRLARRGVLQKWQKGKYSFVLNPPHDFLLANFLYPPSAISLESALSFHGVLSIFPHRITSVTPRKSRHLAFSRKEFFYHHLSPQLYFGYEKRDDFLLAAPEKALFDYLYFCAKGLKSFRFGPEELDLGRIDMVLLRRYCQDTQQERLLSFLEQKK